MRYVTSRFDERKHLVLDEANAIGTAFMRADSLPQDEKKQMQRLLYDYITRRIEVVQSNDVEYIKQTLDSTERMQKDMWSLAMSIAQGDPTPVSALLLQSLNQVVDLHQKRFTVALYHRMPTIFWIALYGLVILAIGSGGI